MGCNFGRAIDTTSTATTGETRGNTPFSVLAFALPYTRAETSREGLFPSRGQQGPAVAPKIMHYCSNDDFRGSNDRKSENMESGKFEGLSGSTNEALAAEPGEAQPQDTNTRMPGWSNMLLLA